MIFFLFKGRLDLARFPQHPILGHASLADRFFSLKVEALDLIFW